MTGVRHSAEPVCGKRIVAAALAIFLTSVGVSRLLGQGGGPPFPTPPIPGPPPVTPGAPPTTTPPFNTPPIAFLNSAQSTPQAGLAGDAAQSYIVTFRPGTTPADRAASAQRAGAHLRFNYRIVNAVAVTVPNVNALAALQRDMSVLQIVPDRAIYAMQASAITPLGKPGGGGGEVVPAGVTRVGLPMSNSDGLGIGVVVADTGIDLDHPDLAVAANRYDAFGGNCDDGNGHGTHVAGIIAALDNERDVIGVAPKVTLYCGKALANNGTGSDSTLIAVLDWVYGNSGSMRVVNMSLGRAKQPDDESGPLREAIQRLYASNIVVVASAGNDPAKEVKDMVPAGFPEVIAVASTTAKDGTNSCSSYSGKILADTASFFTTDGALSAQNIGVTISAPGEDQENISRACFVSSVGILSLKAGGGTTRMSGTSMAAPHVTGVVARVLQKNLASTVETVRTWIRTWGDRKDTAPLNSPTVSYTFDGELEGIVHAP